MAKPIDSSKKTDVFSLVKKLQEILNQKPPPEKIWQEVRMMKFKIKQVFGDLSLINFHNFQMVETLWELGKVDDFFQREIKKIPIKDQELFFHLVDQIKERLEERLSRIEFRPSTNSPRIIEIEVYKERSHQKN